MPRTLPVLIVDDTEICRIGTALMLDQLGFRCELAHNGFDALDLFRPGKYAAVIMDYEMKGMTGAECTSEIRRLESANGRRLPVIGMTSNDSREVRTKCLSGGMDAVLTKDCRAKDLLDILEPLLLQEGLKT
jgi:CheY-like chemotaxis protein